MKTLFIITSIIFCLNVQVSAQNTNKYLDIDLLIEKNSMIDAHKALKKLKELDQKNFNDSEYWLRYSKASYLFYSYDDAKISIEKAIQLSPDNAKYYYEKALLHNKMGSLDTALSALEKAINIKPYGEYYYWRGIVNQQLKNLINAESDYQNALIEAVK